MDVVHIKVKLLTKRETSKRKKNRRQSTGYEVVDQFNIDVGGPNGSEHSCARIVNAKHSKSS